MPSSADDRDAKAVAAFNAALAEHRRILDEQGITKEQLAELTERWTRQWLEINEWVTSTPSVKLSLPPKPTEDIG